MAAPRRVIAYVDLADVTDDELATLLSWQAEEAKRHAGMPCRHAIHLKAVDLMLDEKQRRTLAVSPTGASAG